MSTQDDKLAIGLAVLIGGIATFGGVFAYNAYNEYKSGQFRREHHHGSLPSATRSTTHIIPIHQQSRTEAVQESRHVNLTDQTATFIIGSSINTYTGYRKVTCADWNKSNFRQQLFDHYMSKGGITNEIKEHDGNINELLVFDNSNPIVNKFALTVDNIKNSLCKIYYYTQTSSSSSSSNSHNFNTVMNNNLLNTFSCHQNNKTYNSSTNPVFGSLGFNFNKICACLFVKDNNTSESNPLQHDYATISAGKKTRRHKKSRSRKL